MTSRSRFHEVDAARGRFGADAVDRAIAATRATDEPADRLVRAFRALPGGAGWRMLDAALAGAEVPDAPPELWDVVGPALEPPDWVDLELVDAGAVAQWRVSSATRVLALTCGSLAFGYRSASLSRPLVATGRLTQMAPRRLGETARWVTGVTRPGQLRPDAEGVAATVRLRLVHALVRAHLLRRGDWDTEAWGAPLSVADTVATGLGGFFVIPLDALADLGVHHSPADLEAQFHLWRYVCFLMGAPEEHLPASLPEARRLLDLGLALDSGPHDGSPDLMHALLHHGYAFEAFLPGPLAFVSRQVSAQVLGAFSRRWMGDEMADRLGVPDTPLKHAAPLLRPLNLAREMAVASGVLGDAEAVARREIALVDRVLGLVRAAPEALQPERVSAEPVLRRAA